MLWIIVSFVVFKKIPVELKFQTEHFELKILSFFCHVLNENFFKKKKMIFLVNTSSRKVLHGCLLPFFFWRVQSNSLKCFFPIIQKFWNQWHLTGLVSNLSVILLAVLKWAECVHEVTVKGASGLYNMWADKTLSHFSHNQIKD